MYKVGYESIPLILKNVCGKSAAKLSPVIKVPIDQPKYECDQDADPNDGVFTEHNVKHVEHAKVVIGSDEL